MDSTAQTQDITHSYSSFSTLFSLLLLLDHMTVFVRIIRNSKGVYSISFIQVKSSCCKTQGRYLRRKLEKQLRRLVHKYLRTLIR